jgi:uncharacterized protein YdeI (YjbR/CyaY-like superfamily)
MATTDPRVDAYIAKAADFAKPILNHIRLTVHDVCPEAEETLKWGAPTFMYKGMLCSMAAFKQHAAFGFWRGSLVLDRNGKPVENAMGNFGRLTSVKDLPPKKTLSAYIRKAMALNEQGVKNPTRVKPKVRKALVTPPDLAVELKKNKEAQATFNDFSYSHKKEYVQWITEAKQEETRKRRLQQAIQWMAEGKSRNWKYANC